MKRPIGADGQEVIQPGTVKPPGGCRVLENSQLTEHVRVENWREPLLWAWSCIGNRNTGGLGPRRGKPEGHHVTKSSPQYKASVYSVGENAQRSPLPPEVDAGVCVCAKAAVNELLVVWGEGSRGP